MEQLGQLIKELKEQQSELGKLAKTESTSSDLGNYDYNESLGGHHLEDNKSEPWWKEDANHLSENSECHQYDYDAPLSKIDDHSDISIPSSEKEKIDNPINPSAEKGTEVPIDDQKVDNQPEEKANTFYCPKEGSGGSWEGERGDSKWMPDNDYTPQKHNPENKTWGDVKTQYGIDGVEFKDGEPNFSEVSKGEVTLDQKETDRGIVFNEADTKLAEQRGCEAREVSKWRKENKYTWHETSDGLRVQKVPNIIHGNVSHAGGHSNNLKTL